MAPLSTNSFRGAGIKRRTEVADTTVNETREVGQGVENVQEEEEGRGRPSSKRREKKQQEDADQKKQFFEDPDLGQNINIIG